MKVLLIGGGGRESAIAIEILNSQLRMLFALKNYANKAGELVTPENIKNAIETLENFLSQPQFLTCREQYYHDYAKFFEGVGEGVLVGYLKTSYVVSDLYCALSNTQIASICKTADISLDNNSIVNFCKTNGINLVIIGPEEPLANGLADDLIAEGIKVFGPSKLASQIESSKIFMKNFCTQYNIPTAKYETFYSDKHSKQQIIDFAKQISQGGLPIVLKTNGLAAGKGVAICSSIAEFELELDDYFNGKFGSASQSIVVEQFMQGSEVSFFALCDGTHFKTLPYACDHKKLLDGNKGPNTGGMGTFSHKAILNNQQIAEVEANIIAPLVKGMFAENHPYKGVIFAGLMITNNGIKLIEYNARLGDPETQCILPLIKNNFLQIVFGAIEGVNGFDIELENSACVNVVCVAGGYPDKYNKGDEIIIKTKTFQNAIITNKSHLENISEKQLTAWQIIKNDIKNLFNPRQFLPQIIHCGVATNGKKLTTNGGRVISVRAKASTMHEARSNVYRSLKSIKFTGMFYRKDI